jgi:hypothetical protein
MRITVANVMNALIEVFPAAHCEKALVNLLKGTSVRLTPESEAALEVLEAAGAEWYTRYTADGETLACLNQPNSNVANALAEAFSRK